MLVFSHFSRSVTSACESRSDFFIKYTIMAEIIKNNKNFLIIKLNNEEATKLNFGIFRKDGNNIFICDSCNTICNDSYVYYVASINDILCEDCMNDFIENMNHYIDDNSLKYEVKHFNHYANILNINVKAGITPDGKLVLFSEDEIKE